MASSNTSDSSSLLTPSQRLRLIKSTRKLGKILGTTPLLQLTPLLPSPPMQGRDKSRGISENVALRNTPAATTNHALPSLSHRCMTNPGEMPAMYRTASESDAGRRQPSWMPESPLSPTHKSERNSALSIMSTSTLTSPLSTRFPTVCQSLSQASTKSAEREEKRKTKEAKTKRWKMEKLTRYLGENVPPELVFQKETQQIRLDKRLLHRSRSLGSAQRPLDAHEELTREEEQWLERPLPPERPSADMAHAYLPPKHVILPTQRPEESNEALIHAPDFPPPSPSLSDTPPSTRHSTPSAVRITLYSRARLDADYKAWMAEEDEVWTLMRQETNSNDKNGGKDPMPPRSESRSANLLGRGEERERLDVPELAHRREKRQGWSGEWNAASVQDVIVKLRELK
ncbi:hypothetical protein EW146_g5410 [Bondarzewia mesenterica]|uniref:Uncharacterized protein n=1 Tax=Bondarzewia mesenterica TaxID=1095465 RepID=A0A4S4LTF8_9AGAM|nr:hypothetical protein EW146_g5410 [Bondarzewia mesenterica]